MCRIVEKKKYKEKKKKAIVTWLKPGECVK